MPRCRKPSGEAIGMAAGLAEWTRITAVVKEAALKLWVGQTIPGLASG